MNSDLKFIMEEEQKLVQLVEDSKKSSNERLEEHRVRAEKLRESEFNRISAEQGRLLDEKLREIRENMENRLREIRVKQEHLLEETDLRNKITGRIVALILENRT